MLQELQNLLSGRAFWSTMIALTLLVGYSFIQAVDLYREASKSALGFPELARGMVPLEGILVPTLGAFYLASTLLLPFVALSAVAQDKESGALKLLLQMPFTSTRLVALKAIAMAVAVVALFLPSLSFIPIWVHLGGHVYLPETLNLLAGHALYAFDVAGIAFLAAAFSESFSTGAILALAFTLAFWVLDFAATAGDGSLHRLSFYSLTASLRQFEQGLFSLPAALAMMLGAFSLFALTATWLPTGTAIKEKLLFSLLIVVLFSVFAVAANRAGVYIDVTENRRNSFNPADEAALRKMQSRLLLRIYLSPEDSRLKEMEANVLGKLRRTVPRLEIRYEDTSRRGLFSSVPDDRYGLIVYEYEGKRAESHSNSLARNCRLFMNFGNKKVRPEKDGLSRLSFSRDAAGYAVWFCRNSPGIHSFSWWWACAAYLTTPLRAGKQMRMATENTKHAKEVSMSTRQEISAS